MAIKDRITGALQGSSSRRLLLVAAVVIVGGVAWFVFSPSSPVVAPSDIRSVPNGNETVQGQKPVTPKMDAELNTADQQRLDQAQTQGGSALPTVRATDQKDLNLADASSEEPAPVIKRPAPPVIQRPVVTPAPLPVVQARQAQPDEPVINLADAMGKIALPTYPAAVVTYYSDGSSSEEPSQSQQAAPTAPAAAQSPIQLPLPGTILYAQMINEVNSDSPGPVLAQIVQGDLAGATLIGQFATARDKLVITFTSLTMGTDRDGNAVNATVPIQAFAVDASNIGSGLATDVDYHLLQNIGITFAASFAQGFGQAMSQSGQQVITDGNGGKTIVNPTLTTQQELLAATGTATGAAGQSLSELFGNRPVTVKVRSGTGIGVLFLPSGSN